MVLATALKAAERSSMFRSWLVVVCKGGFGAASAGLGSVKASPGKRPKPKTIVKIIPEIVHFPALVHMIWVSLC